MEPIVDRPRHSFATGGCKTRGSDRSGTAKEDRLKKQWILSLSIEKLRIFDRRPIPILAFAGFAATGISVETDLENYFSDSDGAVRSLAWISSCLILAIWLHQKRPTRHLGIACAALCFPLFAASHSLRTLESKTAPLAEILSNSPQAAGVIGCVDSRITLIPDWQSRNHPYREPITKFDLAVTHIRLGDQFLRCPGRIRVTLQDQLHTLCRGVTLELHGKINTFSSATNPGQRDTRKYFQNLGIHGQLRCDSREQIRLVDVNRSFLYAFTNVIQQFTNDATRTYFTYFDEPQAAFAAALALGQREYLDRPTRNSLIISGTAHLLSVSGLHLGLLVGCLQFFSNLIGISFRTKASLMLIVCIVYPIMTGLRPPVTRSAIMIAVLIIGSWLRRPSDSLNSLCFCALVFMSFDSRLLFDLGVQLSFLAVGTLIYLGRHEESESVKQSNPETEKISQLMENNKNRQMHFLCYSGWLIIRKSLWVSTCIFAVTTPFLWMHFNIVSPISIVANLCVSPLLLIALLLSLCIPVAALCSDHLGNFIAFPCNYVLIAIQKMISLSGDLVIGHAWMPAPATSTIISFYGVMLASLVFRSSRKTSWFRICFIAIWYPVAFFESTQAEIKNNPGLVVTFADVGHGTCAIIRTAGGKTWLYDCGSLAGDARTSDLISRVLWNDGVRKLNGIIISHADSDHYNSLPGILTRFPVDSILVNDTTLQQPPPKLSEALEMARTRGTVISTVSRGDSFRIGEADLAVLHPPAHDESWSDNETSIVLAIEFANRTILLPGDIETTGAFDLLKTVQPTNVDLLMVPHHGAESEESKLITEWVQPDWCIISGGARSTESGMLKFLQQRGCRTLCTQEFGAIRTQIDDTGELEIANWRKVDWKPH